MKVTIETESEKDFRIIEKAFPRSDFLKTRSSTNDTFSLTGAEISWELFIGFAAGVLSAAAYDLVKVFFRNGWDLIDSEFESLEKPIKVTVNGIVQHVHSKDDIEPIIERIQGEIQEQLDLENESRN